LVDASAGRRELHFPTGWSTTPLAPGSYLSANLPQCWIGHAIGDNNMSLTCWPPGSPNLTPCDFSLWGYVKDKAFIPAVPVTLNDLKQHITTATAGVDEDILTHLARIRLPR
jgi:hypothetical protein